MGTEDFTRYGGGLDFFVNNIFYRGPNGHPSRQLGPMDPIASQEGSVPLFLKKHISSSEYPGEGPNRLSPSMDPPKETSLSIHIL